MIYIRDDDILVESKGFRDSFKRFMQVHDWTLLSDRVLHVPTILVTEIQEFPQAIDFINQEFNEGNMLPQLHGFVHEDYGAKDIDTVREHLEKSLAWWDATMSAPIPTKWYTPWGSTQPHLTEAANDYGLEVKGIDTPVLEGPYGVIANMKKGVPPDYLENQDILVHWWNRSPRLFRFCLMLKHGSWDAAKAVMPELFR